MIANGEPKNAPAEIPLCQLSPGQIAEVIATSCPDQGRLYDVIRALEACLERWNAHESRAAVQRSMGRRS